MADLKAFADVLPRDILLLVFGALLGAMLGHFGSLLMWKRQLTEERRKRKGGHVLRALQLALTSLTYLRALLAAKTQGMQGLLNLPANPVDELMGIAALHLHEIVPLVQQLHDKQQILFGHTIEGPTAADSMIRIAQDCEPIVNELIGTLEELAKRQGVA